MLWTQVWRAEKQPEAEEMLLCLYGGPMLTCPEGK